VLQILFHSKGQVDQNGRNVQMRIHRPVRLAYQPPASSTFLSQQISHQQLASSTFLSEQTSTSHQAPAKRTGRMLVVSTIIDKGHHAYKQIG
jgi:hypothetical protein